MCRAAYYGLSYLFDPRYLGHHLLPRVRCNLEELLLNTPADDVTPIDADRKEKLFEQLTAFLVYATHEKDANVFKMLMKGSKTILQYWLIDGH